MPDELAQKLKPSPNPQLRREGLCERRCRFDFSIGLEQMTVPNTCRS